MTPVLSSLSGIMDMRVGVSTQHDEGLATSATVESE